MRRLLRPVSQLRYPGVPVENRAPQVRYFHKIPHVEKSAQKSVKVAIVGNPNVGKSTLLNSLMRQYISSVSSLRNTTLDSVTGVATEGDIQVVFVDTPGLLPGQFRYRRTRRNATQLLASYHKSRDSVRESLLECEVAVFLYDATEPLYSSYITPDIEEIMEGLGEETAKILVINKIDKERDKEKVAVMVSQLTSPLPPIPGTKITPRADIDPASIGFYSKYEEYFREGQQFDEVVALSAVQGKHVNYLWYLIRQQAVMRPWTYSPDTVSPDDLEDVITNLVRSELLTQLGYSQGYTLDHQYIGHKVEGGRLLVEHAMFRNRNLFPTKELRDHFVGVIEGILSRRYGMEVEVRLVEKWHHGGKDKLLESIDFSKTPDIEFLEEE